MYSPRPGAHPAVPPRRPVPGPHGVDGSEKDA